MKASDTNLLHLLNGTKQFLIPIFQRTYRWKEDNCLQLFQDVIRVGGAEYIDSHFIGSVVTIPDQAGQASLARFQVIDGQQRLTTITLFILALLKKAKEFGKDSIAGAMLEGIKEDFLINRHYKDDDRYRLVLTQGDFPALKSLIEETALTDNASKIVINNFQLFCDFLDSDEKIELAYKGLLKLKVVDVTLHTGQDDPQAIFESLNSTGLDLSQADLIRNFVLMRQKHDVQVDMYQRYWFPMEQLFLKHENNRFDRFMQDFLSLSMNSNTLMKARDVYPQFKQWFLETQYEEKDCKVEDLLKRLLQSARHYAAISLLNEGDKDLLVTFRDLRKLVEVASPTVMKLYQCYEAEQLSKSDFIVAVRYLESYILRRLVCGMETRSLGNIFAALAQKIEAAKPLESLKVALARLSKNNRYPSDTEFKEGLVNKDLYESRICKFVLERLENGTSKEKLDTKDLTIEHIMPQNKNLKPGWQAMLGDDWKNVQETWLHRLGNLTLTGYNSKYSDEEFKDKKEMTDGFDTSPLRLNLELKNNTEWNVTKMTERGSRLSKEAVKVWGPLMEDPKLILQYILRDKKKVSGDRKIEDVKGINDNNKALSQSFVELVEDICPDVTSVYGKKNITVFTPSPFVQIVPRTRNITILLALDYEQLDSSLQNLCNDTNNKSFIPNATISGTYLRVESISELDSIKPLIIQAYKEAVA